MGFLQQSARTYYGVGATTDLVQLGTFGEGYLTSLEAARRLVEGFNATGIIGCPDEQLNMNLMPDVIRHREVVYPETPWELRVQTNAGDCLRTAMINSKEKAALQALRSPDEEEAAQARRDVESFGYERLAHARKSVRYMRLA